MSHSLDRPIWSALSSRHAGLAEGGPRARRYPPSIIPFGAAADDSAQSCDALRALMKPGESIAVVEAGALPSVMRPFAQENGTIVQMLLAQVPDKGNSADIARLTKDDAPDMLALARLTEPGPFTLNAQALGPFFGIRRDGMLAAMAGVRMSQDGYTEISGICTHPACRGQGLAKRLTSFILHRVRDAGDTPYLHVRAENAAAISLYRSLGFEPRIDLTMAVIHASL